MLVFPCYLHQKDQEQNAKVPNKEFYKSKNVIENGFDVYETYLRIICLLIVGIGP